MPEEEGKKMKKSASTSSFYKNKWWNEPHEDELGLSAGGHSDVNMLPASESEENLTPAQKVRMMLTEEGEDVDDYKLETSFLFCQLDLLCDYKEGGRGWTEMARWLKYEEKVEEGNRWSKPHLATTSLHSLFEIRQGMLNGEALVLLDMGMKHTCKHSSAGGKEKLHDQYCAMFSFISDELANVVDITDDVKKLIFDTLVLPHKHQNRKTGKAKEKEKEKEPVKKPQFPAVHQQERRASLYHPYADGLLPESHLEPYKPNKRLLKKIAVGTEAANILIGHCEFLRAPVMVLARLNNSAILGDLTEVELPTRFVFIAIGPKAPKENYKYEEIGRAMGCLFSDKVFCQVAYKAKTTQDIVDGLDEFIDGLTVLPPSIWDPQTRLDPPDQLLSQDAIEERLKKPEEKIKDKLGDEHEDTTLMRTGRLFGGVWMDIKRRYPLYLSDITDAFNVQSLASVIFLYFACITPIVTFGGLLGNATDLYLGTMETLVSGFVCGLIYHLFAGQPLTIVGATGPMLIFESLLYSICQSQGMDFLAFRFWTGFWIMVILLVFVAFDLSSLVRYITRFTEECFSLLISIIFIYEAFLNVIKIWDYYPVNTRPDEDLPCHCVPKPFDENATEVTLAPNTTEAPVYQFVNFSSNVKQDCVNVENQLIVGFSCVEKDYCLENGWVASGPGCEIFNVAYGAPDVFFLCCFLFIGTFTIGYAIRNFRTAPVFPSIVRNNVSNFAVLIAILICVGADIGFGLRTPKLEVPSEFKPSRSDRNWWVDPFKQMPWYALPAAIIPALLAVILIFLDHQITCVIVNRKEHKLKKGHGYHLDLFILAITIMISSAFGLPWFVAATVRAITHVRSLVVYSETSNPGEAPEMVGVREQRLTGICVHILIGLSTLATPILAYIPMAVLYGVFLYMGVTSLAGVQFVERITILLMPQKYQPDTIYLRHVQTKRVHLFTFIQILCMILMWTVKSIKKIAILFPITILVVCFVRKGLDYVFSQTELFWLDHLLPDATMRQKEDMGEVSEDEDDSMSIDKDPNDFKIDLDQDIDKVPKGKIQYGYDRGSPLLTKETQEL